MHAVDPDLGSNGRVVYQLDRAAASPDIIDSFRVDPHNGKVFLQRALDYEVRTSYKVPIIATDKRHPVTSSTTLIVRVRDVNDEKPIISVDYLGKPSAEIEENKERDELLAFITVKDKDRSSPNSNVECSLINQAQRKRYDLTKTSRDNDARQKYFLKTSVGLDREKLPSDRVLISCKDLGTPPQSTTATVALTVLDVNDNEPVLSLRDVTNRIIAEARVQENVRPNTVVARLHAKDEDKGANGTVTFSMDQSDTATLERFRIRKLNAHESDIITIGLLDREATNPPTSRFSVVVTARDGGGRSAEIRFFIQLEDVNDNAPEFAEKIQTFTVKEMENAGTNLGQIFVSDRDNNAQIRVKIHRDDMRQGLPFEVSLAMSWTLLPDCLSLCGAPIFEPNETIVT